MGSDAFDHVFIQPGSYEASLRFYQEHLGWKVEYAWGDALSPRGACLSSGTMKVVLAENYSAADHSKSHGINGTRPTIHLRVQDIDARYAQVVKSGCALFPPERTHWGTLWFVAKDPDGNLVAFEQHEAG